MTLVEVLLTVYPILLAAALIFNHAAAKQNHLNDSLAPNEEQP